MERYSRNILIDNIGIEGQQKLLESKVLVSGAGGLGSTVIANLASLGIGNIGIIDNDTLELSNLNRQYIHKYKDIGQPKSISAKNWINDYNPDIKVETFNLKLDENNYKELINKYDIIVDCFDSFKSKFLLNDIAVKTGKPLIHGGVTGFRGQALTILPKQTACLRCLIPDADINAYIVKGVVSPVVSTIASIESIEILKLILGIGDLLTNQLLVFNALTLNFKKVELKRDDNCTICSK